MKKLILFSLIFLGTSAYAGEPNENDPLYGCPECFSDLQTKPIHPSKPVKKRKAAKPKKMNHSKVL